MTPSDIFRPLRQTLLSDNWGVLTRHEYDLKGRDGTWSRQTREVYDRGNGATCLLYNPDTGTVLLTQQFRLPAMVNGGKAALIETPAGLLDGAEAAQRMRAELVEETGFAVSDLTHLFNIYMSPGSVTEYLACFLGSYGTKHRVSDGGGVADEGEDITVLHIPLPRALAMVQTGEICDGKTVILLYHLALRQGLTL